MRQTLLTICFAAAMGASASAQSTAPPKPPSIDPAALKAMGDAMIAQSGGEDVFRNESEDGGIKIVHRETGFVCFFDPGDPSKEVTILPSAKRGGDIACSSRAQGAVVSLYLTKFPAGTTLDQAFNTYLREVTIVHPDAKPAEGTFPVMSASSAAPLAPHKSTQFNYMQGGSIVFSRLSVAVVNDWVIEQRITGDNEKGLEHSLLGELTMVASIVSMTPSDKK